LLRAPSFWRGKNKGVKRVIPFFLWTYAQHRIERESGSYSGTRRVDKKVTAFFSCPFLFSPFSEGGEGEGWEEEGINVAFN